MKRLLGLVVSPIRWAVVVLCFVFLVAPVGYTAVSGQEIVRVDGNSMAPVMRVGDVILISAAGEGELRVGDVVTVEPDGSGRYTHRITDIDGDVLTLQGDANEAVDPLPVSVDEVRGVVRQHLAAPWSTALLLVNAWPMRVSLAVLLIGLLFLPAPSRTAVGSPEPSTDSPTAPTGADDSRPTREREH